MKYTHAIILLLLVAVATPDAHSAVLLREFKGTKSTVTPEFTVEAPWIIDWRLFGDYEQLVVLDVQLLDARTGYAIGRVLHTKAKGNGVRLFSESGSYRLRISSALARWTLRVEQLTEEEAELYTPIRP